MFILTAAYACTGWSYVFPMNVRLVWLILFTPFTALGFWIGLHEAQMFPPRRGAQTALTLIGLFPFFLYTLLMAALGSLSGMLGGSARAAHLVAGVSLWQPHPGSRAPSVADGGMHGGAALLAHPAAGVLF